MRYSIVMINHKAHRNHEYPQADTDDLAAIVAFGDSKVGEGEYDAYVITDSWNDGQIIDVDLELYKLIEEAQSAR